MLKYVAHIFSESSSSKIFAYSYNRILLVVIEQLQLMEVVSVPGKIINRLSFISCLSSINMRKPVDAGKDGL